MLERQRPALGRASSFSSSWILALLVGVFTGVNARADEVSHVAATTNPPLPSGYTARAAHPGELKPNQAGFHDGGKKEIVINLTYIGGHLEGEDTTGTLARLIRVALNHELGHTEHYGAPSDPGQPGFGNGLCAHWDLYSKDHDNLCEQIEQAVNNGESTHGMCSLDDAVTDMLNSMLIKRNEGCSGAENVTFLCAGCEGD